jgi:hypothetical protein
MAKREPDGSFERGVQSGMERALLMCLETARDLDRATSDCEDEDPELSELTGAGAIYMRHLAAKLRATLGQRPAG